MVEEDQSHHHCHWSQDFVSFPRYNSYKIEQKGHVKLMQQVKIAHSTLSNLFHFTVLSLAMLPYIWLSKNFLKPTSKNGEIGHFNQSLLIWSI